MTAVNPRLAAAIAAKGVPLSADLVGPQSEPDLRAENERLRRELDSYKEQLSFLERNTLPELRRTIQHHEDGKKRWRDRAVKAETERDRLKLAWQSARQRAQGYGEAVVRIAGERNSYVAWLEAAEAQLVSYNAISDWRAIGRNDQEAAS